MLGKVVVATDLSGGSTALLHRLKGLRDYGTKRKSCAATPSGLGAKGGLTLRYLPGRTGTAHGALVQGVAWFEGRFLHAMGDVRAVALSAKMVMVFPSQWAVILQNPVLALRLMVPNLLVLDDFGLKPLHPPAPEGLYDVINERYEQGSILLTSNRAPSEWPALFRDPLLASAGLDRLAHKAHVLVSTGASYRAQGRPRIDEEVATESRTAAH